ncbi:MAG: MFS transporter [Candidatus Thorarchaeota archaeon]
MSKLDALAKRKAEKGEETLLRSKGYLVFIIIYMGLIGLMDNYLALIENVAFYYVMEDFGVSPAELAFWQGIYGIISFGVFIIGWLSDSFGRKKGILLLLVVMGIPALLIGLISITFHLFMLLYAFVTFGTISNLWEVPITEESPAEKRGTYGGLVTLLSLIPLYAFVGVAIATNLGWRWTYGIMFFFMIILMIPLIFMKEPKRWLDAKEERGHKFLKLKTALKSLNRKDFMYILLATLVYGTWGVVFKLSSTWGMHYYVNIVGYSEADYSRVLMVAGLCILGGAITAGILLDKIGRKLTLIVGCSGSVIGLVFLGITTLPIFVWMGYFFMALTFVWIMVYFAEIFPNEIRSTATGITASTARVSYVMGPLLASVLLLTFPTMEWYWIIAGMLMLIPLLSLLAKPYETKGMTLEAIKEKR